MSVLTDTIPEAAPPRSRSDSRRGSAADVLFDVFFGGGVGGSAIALFFLAVDAIGGRVLHTPSVMGTALFTSETVTAATPVQNDLVVFYSLVHFAMFGLVALGVAQLLRRWPALDRSPLAIASVVFAVLTVSLIAADLLVLNGVVAAIGLVPVLAANAVTGLALATFFRWSHHQMR